MYKLAIILSLFLFSTLLKAEEVFEDPIFRELDQIGKGQKIKNEEELNKSLRFTYTTNKYHSQNFVAVLLKGAILQSLDATEYIEVKENITVRAEEVSPASKYVYIFNKYNKPKFVTFSKHLKKIDKLIQLNPKKQTFKRDKFSYSGTDPQAGIKLNTLISSGSHNLNFFDNNSTISSIGIHSEIGLTRKMYLPTFVLLSYESLTGNELNWNNTSIGLKTSKHWQLSDKYAFSVFISIKRTILSSATLNKSISFDLTENRYALGMSLKRYKNIFSFELAKERIFFPSNLKLSNFKITNTKTYHSSIIFKIGREFEFNL